MTSASLSSSTERAPFLLAPSGKDYLWGGERLNDDFNKNFDCSPLAETWECSTHPDGESVVRSGPYAGLTLRELLALHPDYLGTNLPDGAELPVLVKFIDARHDLSVQVHPSDDYARIHEHGACGKSEMWYVVEAAKGAHLIYGFLHDTDRETVRAGIADGTLLRHLQKVPVRKGDVFYIPAGQVHALGAGCLVAEVQESSNITYRLYDYDRVDKNGEKRPLHVERALEVANLRSSAAPRQPMEVVRFRPGTMIELLCRCPWFQVEKITVDTQRCRGLARFKAKPNTFRALLCIEGCGTISWGDTADERLNFFRGDSIFVPANSVEYSVHGMAQLLRVSC